MDALYFTKPVKKPQQREMKNGGGEGPEIASKAGGEND